MSKKTLLFIVILTVFSSCSYQWSSPLPLSIYIPKVEGDEEGIFTNLLIETLEKSSSFRYRGDRGAFSLKVKIIGIETEKVGFQRDREEVSGEILDVLRPSENRDKLYIELSVCSDLGKEVLGPYFFQETITYDYVDGNSLEDLSFLKGGKRETSLQFSLGQLQGMFPAKKGARKDLFKKIAEKIVERLSLDHDRLLSRKSPS